MPPPGEATGNDQPPVCEIRDWQVFANGYHKGTLYTPAEVREIAANFARLRGRLTPVMGLGHDKTQRLASSLGLPNVGSIEGCEADNAGNLALTIRGVPTWLGGMVNAGRYRSGSVELKTQFPDPDDPSQRLPGSVLDGVALLGEEQPSVKGCPPPKAVFADGTPVPPNWEPMPVPAETVMPAGTGPVVRDDPSVLCFSAEVPAVTPEQMLAAFQAMTPEQQQAFLAQAKPPAAEFGSDELRGKNQDGQIKAIWAKDPSGANAPSDVHSASTTKKFDATPDPQSVPSGATAIPPTPPVAPEKPADMSQLYAAFTAFADKCEKRFADSDKRIGGIEALKADEKKKADESAMSAAKAFSADVVDRAIREGKIFPRDRELHVSRGVEVVTTKTFSDKTGDAAVQAWRQDIEGRQQTFFFSDVASPDPKANPTTPALTPLQARMVRPGGVLDRVSPRVTKALREPAAA